MSIVYFLKSDGVYEVDHIKPHNPFLKSDSVYEVDLTYDGILQRVWRAMGEEDHDGPRVSENSHHTLHLCHQCRSSKKF